MKNNPQLPYSSLIKELGLNKVSELSKRYRSSDLVFLDYVFSLLNSRFDTDNYPQIPFC